MNMVRSPSSIGSTYTGLLYFLDNQTGFYNIFGLAPNMLLVTARSLLMRLKSMTLFDQRFQLCVVALNCIFFCNIVQLQYVGTETYDSNWMMSDISFALSTLKFEFELRRKNINLTSDCLYRRYIQHLPLLPSNTMA